LVVDVQQGDQRDFKHDLDAVEKDDQQVDFLLEDKHEEGGTQ
jgi:hypothetical protein